MKILLVEDNRELLETLGEALSIEGYAVDQAPDGETALLFLDIGEYDLIILDLNLPKMSGFDVLSYAIRKDRNAKVLILSAYSDIETKVKGLDLGASDYMDKPFVYSELKARIRMLMRREYTLKDTVLECGELKFDTIQRILYVREIPLVLTRKETAVIEYLMMYGNRIVSVEELLAHAWSSESDSVSSCVRTHVFTLRKKIKDIIGWNPIRNRIGEGYFLVADRSTLLDSEDVWKDR